MCFVCGHHAGMTFLGLPQNGSHFMVVQNTMTTTTMLVDRARATLLRCSPTVITSMELTRFFYIWFCFCMLNFCFDSGLIVLYSNNVVGFT